MGHLRWGNRRRNPIRPVTLALPESSKRTSVQPVERKPTVMSILSSGSTPLRTMVHDLDVALDEILGFTDHAELPQRLVNVEAALRELNQALSRVDVALRDLRS